MEERMVKFHEKVKAGKTLIGTHVICNDSQLTEVMGNNGFDYFWLDTEHTAIDLYQVVLHLIAARATDTPVFVRIPWNDMVLAKPILEMGIQGMIFPLIKTVEDAKKAVEACLYPPEGVRGWGPRRAIKYGLESPDEYLNKGHKEVLRMIQIETREAVDNIDAIAAIPEVDILVLGPADLSGSYGKFLKFKDPEMMKIYGHVAERAHKAGKKALVSNANYGYDMVKMWVELGFDMITAGSEAAFIMEGSKTYLANAAKVLADLGK